MNLYFSRPRGGFFVRREVKIMKKFLIAAIVVFFFVPFMGIQAGFDEFGYNDTARNFVGTCKGWHMGKFASTEADAEAYCGIYTNDKLVMKWNAEWDRGNAEGWTDPDGYDAWMNNEWNGKKDGSGEVWHYKIVWVGDYVQDPSVLPEGSYGIWGQFAVLMDQGTAGGEHFWLTHGIPSGYGAYR